MMTAGQIASALGVKEVQINYKASETLLEYYKKNGIRTKYLSENPMPKLEFSVYGSNFKNMKSQNPKYQSEKWFPSDVNFSEAPEYENDKKDIFEKFPETLNEAMTRGIGIVEHLNKKI